MGRYNWEAIREAARTVLTFDPENCEALDLLTGAEQALDSSAPPPTSQPTSSPPTTTAMAAPDHPTSFANSRYQVQRFLGDGGKKRVYPASWTRLHALWLLQTGWSME